MSILSHLDENNIVPPSLSLIYSVRMPRSQDMGHILFLDRLKRIFSNSNSGARKSFSLYLTEHQPSTSNEWLSNSTTLRYYPRRFGLNDLIDYLPALEKRLDTVAYVCGPPRMTDDVVAFLKGLEGISPEQILCEKWW